MSVKCRWTTAWEHLSLCDAANWTIAFRPASYKDKHISIIYIIICFLLSTTIQPPTCLFCKDPNIGFSSACKTFSEKTRKYPFRNAAWHTKSKEKEEVFLYLLRELWRHMCSRPWQAPEDTAHWVLSSVPLCGLWWHTQPASQRRCLRTSSWMETFQKGENRTEKHLWGISWLWCSRFLYSEAQNGSEVWLAVPTRTSGAASICIQIYKMLFKSYIFKIHLFCRLQPV